MNLNETINGDNIMNDSISDNLKRTKCSNLVKYLLPKDANEIVLNFNAYVYNTEKPNSKIIEKLKQIILDKTLKDFLEDKFSRCLLITPNIDKLYFRHNSYTHKIDESPNSAIYNIDISSDMLSEIYEILSKEVRYVLSQRNEYIKNSVQKIQNDRVNNLNRDRITVLLEDIETSNYQQNISTEQLCENLRNTWCDRAIWLENVGLKRRETTTGAGVRDPAAPERR